MNFLKALTEKDTMCNSDWTNIQTYFGVEKEVKHVKSKLKKAYKNIIKPDTNTPLPQNSFTMKQYIVLFKYETMSTLDENDNLFAIHYYLSFCKKTFGRLTCTRKLDQLHKPTEGEESQWNFDPLSDLAVSNILTNRLALYQFRLFDAELQIRK